jgi:N6-L-threonylcarbamoyladenine synthase
VGVTKAQELSQTYGLPYVRVHHMEAHALVARLEADVAFPFVCLLVSGGHNMLVTVHGVGQYTLLGSTFDDALGE